MPLLPEAELQWWYQFYFATDRAETATTNIGVIFPDSSGSLLRQNGTSTTPRLGAARQPSTIPITSLSSFTITAGGSASSKVSQNMTIRKSGWRNPP